MMSVRSEVEERGSGYLCSSGSSRSSIGNTTADANVNQPSTSATANMGGEHKLPSSSREMRNMAEKMRRDKLNYYITQLAGIVPLGSGANKRIDKTSVLRLAANYLRMHKILRDDDEESGGIPQVLGGDVTHRLVEAMGGFLLVVTSSGKVVYITEAVDQFFGHSQVDLLGHSIYSVIHPDDHEIFQQQLTQKESSRRSFFCRMMEKAASRSDPGRYEIIHVVGHLRPVPQTASAVSSPCVLAPSPSGTYTSSDHDEDDESDGDCQALKVSLNRIGTHMLVSFVRVVKDRPITELSLVESTQDEYISRHGKDGKILYTDHRISFITGLMPAEVLGTSAFSYMHPDDMIWSMVAQRLMFTSTQGQGVVSYRLKCRDGAHVTLRSRGYLEVNNQTGQVESFVCINTVVGITEAASEIKDQRRKLLPLVMTQESDDHVSSISPTLPPELLMVLKQMTNPETVKKMINSVDCLGAIGENQNSEDIGFMDSDIPGQQYRSHKKSSDFLNDQKEGCMEANPFQGRPKRIQTFDEFGSPFECFDSKSPALLGSRKRISNEDPRCGTSNKRTMTDDSDTVSSKKFNFDNESYQSGSCQTQQYNSITSPHMCSTSPLLREDENHSSNSGLYHDGASFTHPKSPKNCVSVCYQQKSDHMPSVGSQEQATVVSMVSLGVYSCDKSGGVHMSVNFDQNRNKRSPSPKTYNQITKVDMVSPGTHDQSVSLAVPSPGNYDHILSGNMTSTGHCEHGKSASIISSDGSHETRIGNIPPNNSVKNRHGMSISSPGSYPHHSGGIPSAGNFEQTRMNMTFSGSHQQNESYTINVPGSRQNYSSNIMSESCTYQPMEGDTITSSEDQSSFSQSQFLPQYSQTSGVQSSQQPQQYHQQQQPIMEHSQSNTSLRHHLRLSLAPEFDIKLQRQRTVPYVGEPEARHISSPTNLSQCLPFGTTGISGNEGEVYRYPATSAALERDLSLQSSANFHLDSTRLSSETSQSHCQPSSENQLQSRLATKDCSRHILTNRQLQQHQPYSQQGGKLL